MRPTVPTLEAFERGGGPFLLANIPLGVAALDDELRSSPAKVERGGA